MEFNQLGMDELNFDPTVYNTVYDYGYIVSNTTDYSIK
jgi:hypothetical protein